MSSPRTRNSAARNAGIFLLVGSLWIATSDKLLLGVVAGGLDRYALLQTYKGWLFVALTTALIYVLTHRALKLQEQTQRELRLVDDRYRRLITHLTVGVYHTDRTGTVVYLNEQATRIIGLPLEHALGRGWLSAVESGERARISAKISAAVERGEPFYDEWRFLHADYTWVSVVSVARPECGDDGRVIGYIGTLTDVTELKRVSDSLRRSEANFRALVEQSLTGVFVVQGGRYVYVNPRMQEIQGYSVDELLELPDATVLVVEEERAAAAEFLARVESGEEPLFHANFRCQRKDGSIAVVEALGAHTDWSGAPAIIGTAIDITAHEQAQAALRESEDRFKIFMDANPAIAWIMDADGRYLYMNRAWEEEFGLDRKGYVGSTGRALLAPAAAERMRELDSQVLDSHESLATRDDFVRLDGVRRVWDTVRFSFRTSDDRLEIGGVAIDVTAKTAAEDRVAELQERLRLAVVAGNVGLWEWDLRKQQAFYSDECKRQLGYAPEEISAAYDEWERRVHPDDLDQTLRALREAVAQPELPYASEHRMQHKDGSYRWILAQGRVLLGPTGKPARLIGSHIDITRLKEAEETISASHLRLDQVLRTNPTVLYALKVEGAGVIPDWISDSVTRILGYTPQEALEPDWWSSHLHPDDRERCLQLSTTLFEREQLTNEYRFQHKDGSWLVIRDELRMLRDDGGRPTSVIAAWSDITAAHAERERMRLYAAALANTHEGVVITDLAGTIVSVNHATTEITGYSEAELIGQNPRILQSGKHEVADYQAMWSALLGTGSWQGEMWNRRKDGSLYPQLLAISAVRDEGGVPRYFAAIATDITHLKQVEHQLTHLAHHDALTDLPNRLLVNLRLEHAIAHAARHGSRVGILFLDLDDFKKINDGLGHTIGDELLVAVAGRLGLRVRAEDTLGRLGGDEFLVILEKIGDTQAIANVARDLRGCVAQPIALSSGHQIYIEASIGISVYPDDGATGEELLRCADTALYRAKSDLRGRVCFFTQEMGANAAEQLELEAALRSAIESGDLLLYYQPKIDLHSKALCGAEALVRWRREDGRLESPAKFIPVAERTGLIGPLGDWVIDAACRQQRVWRDAGLVLVEVAVNLSVQQFGLVNLEGVVTSALARYDLAPGLLGLEITESSLMDQPERAIDIMRPLKRAGIRIYLDDFGTGFSNLAYLNRLPLDVLKIDASFVGAIGSSTEADALVDSVIALARGIGLGTIAEGVETAAQAEFLLAHGCDQVQGFHFNRPLPANEFERLLTRADQALVYG